MMRARGSTMMRARDAATRPRGGLAAVAAVALLVLGAPAVRAQDGFVVGPGDRLVVSVHRRSDLSGDFRVLPGGGLSLPFIGTLPVAGLTIEDVRQALMRRLREDASLLDPRVSVEIAEMQPVLVSGAVRRPGQYPFQLGMTVGHAVAAAGGPRRLELEEVGARVEVSRLRERLRTSQDAMGLALIRRARLLAEGSGAENFDAPPEAARFLPPDRLAQTLEAEREILRRRNDAHTSLVAMLATQQEAYNDEIRALESQGSSKEREADLLTQESRYIENLMRQGLSPRTTRVIELARMAIQVEGERRQILAFMARARQEIARIEQTRINAGTQRQLDVANGLKDADDAMATLRVAVEESRSGLAQLNEALPAEDAPVGPRGPAAITILRVRASPAQRIAAGPDTVLMPGDLVEITTEEAAPGGRRLAAGQPR
jgi:protein involved in polysaccharide export with SLBB domain